MFTVIQLKSLIMWKLFFITEPNWFKTEKLINPYRLLKDIELVWAW